MSTAVINKGLLKIIYGCSLLWGVSCVAAPTDAEQSSAADIAINTQWPTSVAGVLSPTVKKARSTNKLIVKYRDEVNSTIRRSLAAAYSYKTIQNFNSVTNLSVVEPDKIEPATLMKKLKSDPNVEYVEWDQEVQFRGIPDDTDFFQLWAMNNTNDVDINAVEAWDITTGNRDIVLAVIDSGVAYDHADLIDNMWINPNEIPANGIDDDGNGYIDDVVGIDGSVIASPPGTPIQTDPYDTFGHGTHVAGTIGARGNNDLGVSGVNQQTSILACKIDGISLEAFVSAAIVCLDYVWDLKVNHGINIVASNASWGWIGKRSSALYDVLLKHREAGILFVTAAGNSLMDNNNLQDYPSTYYLPNIIAVSAHNAHDEQSFFTNYGARTVHLSAPGENILSTIPIAPDVSQPPTLPVAIPAVVGDIFFDDMESGTGNWTAEPVWAIDNSNVLSGVAAWTDSPGGMYASNVDSSLTSITLDLSSRAGQPTVLGLNTSLDMESCCDFLRIEVSGNDGVTWTIIGELTGNSLPWTAGYYSIPDSVLTTSFRFRFHFTTDSSVIGDGVYIDDISISTGTGTVVDIPYDYMYASGTSMAAPHVVGALGLLKAQNANRDWSQLKNLVLASGKPFNTGNQPTITNRRLRLWDTDGSGALTCNDQKVLSRLRPMQDEVDLIEDPEGILNLAFIHINCENPAGNVIATIDELGQKVVLQDNGIGFDQFSGDGIYSASVNLMDLGISSVTISVPGQDSIIARLRPRYSVSTVAYAALDLLSPELIDVPPDSFAVIKTPFAIQFSGESYDAIHVSEDGFLEFTYPRILGIPSYINTQIPTRSYESMIAPYWMDLETSVGQIVSQTLGQSPNRQFVIEWQNMMTFSGSAEDTVTFQVVFYENNNDIRFNYKNVIFNTDIEANLGALATVGIQISSTLAIMNSFEEPVIANQSSLLWTMSEVTTPAPSPSNGGVNTPISNNSSGGGGGSLLWLILAALMMIAAGTRVRIRAEKLGYGIADHK